MLAQGRGRLQSTPATIITIRELVSSSTYSIIYHDYCTLSDVNTYFGGR